MTEEPLFADHNVLSTYASMETARAAVGSLENHGIDAGHISLLGRQVEEAHEHRGTERDQAMLDKAAKTAVGGAATGSAVGGAVGLLAGLAAFGVPGIGPAVGAGIWATTLGGAAAGGGVG
ncbi:MAG: hypothetical protein M3N52_09085, partial [Actinomycetota bacterium]|nr:hypothetical protein [Actinomycetota bacterium]